MTAGSTKEGDANWLRSEGEFLGGYSANGENARAALQADSSRPAQGAQRRSRLGRGHAPGVTLASTPPRPRPSTCTPHALFGGKLGFSGRCLTEDLCGRRENTAPIFRIVRKETRCERCTINGTAVQLYNCTVRCKAGSKADCIDSYSFD